MKKLLTLVFAIGIFMTVVFMGCKHEVVNSGTTDEESSGQTQEVEVLTFTGTPYTELPDGTDGTFGPSGKYVFFGDWPQTIKANNVEIDESKIAIVGMFTYYKGNDDAWYVKIKENAYDTGYKYSNESEVLKADADSYKYFKVEPIKWRVLSYNYNGKPLLLAENILVNCAYYDYYNLLRDGNVYPNNYKESRIRAYLNGLSYSVKSSADNSQVVNDEFKGKGFLQTAFTESIRFSIATNITIDNSAVSANTDANPTQWNGGENVYTCEDTKDRIFLLSEQEATKSGYGFAVWNEYVGDENETTESTRIRMTTDFSKANGAMQSTSVGFGGSWWVRTPYFTFNNFAIHVCGNGGANGTVSVVNTGCGVCPALCLK